MTDAAGHEHFEGGPNRSAQLLQIVIDSIPQRVFWKDRNPSISAATGHSRATPAWTTRRSSSARPTSSSPGRPPRISTSRTTASSWSRTRRRSTSRSR